MPRRYTRRSAPRPTVRSSTATPASAAAAATLDPLGRHIETALGGEVRPLYAFLARHSGLPGVRVNATIVQAFASHAATRGKKLDALVRTMTTIDADRAPGGTELEILPVCGVAALGARAASDPKAVKANLALLEAAAEDLRFRVRDEVPRALSRIGAARGEPLVVDLKAWTDGFFQAAAVLLAATDNAWLSTIHDPEPLIARLEEAFQLARGADRADERYPGYKSLVQALTTTPAVFAARFGAPVFDRLVAWSTVKEPMLRDAIAASLGGTRLSKRFASDVARVKLALEASAPVRRDPLTDVGPTRRRGKKRIR
jgi:hypothetical protein